MLLKSVCYKEKEMNITAEVLGIAVAVIEHFAPRPLTRVVHCAFIDVNTLGVQWQRPKELGHIEFPNGVEGTDIEGTFEGLHRPRVIVGRVAEAVFIDLRDEQSASLDWIGLGIAAQEEKHRQQHAQQGGSVLTCKKNFADRDDVRDVQ